MKITITLYFAGSEKLLKYLMDIVDMDKRNNQDIRNKPKTKESNNNDEGKN